ncbi:MAG TPA: OsmC family protein [Alloacidobacterium sp.]|nr:OsmC family protein [Alloacidobacterium sp.]
MIAKAEWKQGTQYDGLSESGHTIHFDTDQAHTTGPSPMEAVLTALCGCTSVDVVSILQKKREPLTSLVVSAEAEQSPAPPRVFTHIRLIYRVGGPVSRKAMEDAVALSKNKYCSVSKMLEKSATIEFAIEYADGDPGE